MPKRGLVIGKFYPPHHGHRLLIDRAATEVEQLTVLVCDTPGQVIPATRRADWLRETHPTADVRVIPDIGRDDDSAAWAAYTRTFLGYTPDLVATSEDYGPRYARELGCTHLLVDRPRRQVPISGTAVRRDPYAVWSMIDSGVRQHYVKRVCVLGAESTGTTTMAKALAEAYRTTWVPEYGRTYSEVKYHDDPAPKWTSDEFVFIAKEQNRQEDELARQANRVLICDTNAFATGIWHERYMGFRSELVERAGRERTPDLYLLTDVDIPFVQDGLRDGEHLRHWMHDVFVERLNQQPVPWELLSGPHARRLKQARQAIDRLFSRHTSPQRSHSGSS